MPDVSSQPTSITLTQREMVVLKMICEEYTNVQIAEKLFISSRTVDGHRTNLLAKTSSKNTAGLVVFAIKHGFFEIR
jgi:DNA-binding CsgD family transcriptional regulator